jgi:RNA polymerase sigma-70 factor (ECF subfamily)
MAKNFLIVILVFATLFLCSPFSKGADNSEVSPKVIATNPANGATDVDPSLAKITVTFNKQMLDKSWSWSYEDKDSFPQTAGQPFYTDKEKTCVLPVKLEPGRQYVLWINTARFKNFKDRSGNAVEPYKLSFTTSGSRKHADSLTEKPLDSGSSPE